MVFCILNAALKPNESGLIAACNLNDSTPEKALLRQLLKNLIL